MKRVSLVLCIAVTLHYPVSAASPPGDVTPPGDPARTATSPPPKTGEMTVAKQSRRLQVAVTFDDLPAHGPLLPRQSLVDVHRAILDVLERHGVKQAYGFINGAKVQEHGEGRRVLELWRDAGHPLGNHTWSHPDLGEVGAGVFIREIERNDALLADIVGDSRGKRNERRVFRYPYLREGRDRVTLDAVRGHLERNGYRLGWVTVDFGDWAYNPAYVRCAQKGDEKTVDALRRDFVGRGTRSLLWSDAAARAIFGEPIPQILLLHSGSFDAAVLDDLLTAYEKAGVSWITLDQALSHEAYLQDVRVPSKYGGSLLEQVIERDDPPHPPFFLQPLGLLDRLCR